MSVSKREMDEMFKDSMPNDLNNISIKCTSTYPRNKYMREIKSGIFVDVYEVLRAFEVTDQAIGHAIKKLLAGGKRGYKSEKQDLQEAIDSIKRAIEIIDDHS